MEAVQPLLLSGIRGPGLTAVQQGADDTCLVDLELWAQLGHHCGGLRKAGAQFCVK